MDDSRKVAIRVGVTLLGWALGYALFGTETKFGPIPAMGACGITAMGLGYLFTSGDSESTATSGQSNSQSPSPQKSSLVREKTCPACISQVPFIASKCKFCGTELEVQDLGGGRPSISDQLNASNAKNQIDDSQSAWGRPSENDDKKL